MEMIETLPQERKIHPTDAAISASQQEPVEFVQYADLQRVDGCVKRNIRVWISDQHAYAQDSPRSDTPKSSNKKNPTTRHSDARHGLWCSYALDNGTVSTNPLLLFKDVTDVYLGKKIISFFVCFFWVVTLAVGPRSRVTGSWFVTFALDGHSFFFHFFFAQGHPCFSLRKPAPPRG